MEVALGSWSDNKQRTVSASTNGAGYIALIHALRVGVLIRRFLNEMALGKTTEIT